MDAVSLPRQRHRACNVIKQAGGTARLGFVFAAASNLAGKTDRAIGQTVQAIATAVRHIGRIIESCMQVGRQR